MVRSAIQVVAATGHCLLRLIVGDLPDVNPVPHPCTRTPSVLGYFELQGLGAEFLPFGSYLTEENPVLILPDRASQHLEFIVEIHKRFIGQFSLVRMWRTSQERRAGRPEGKPCSTSSSNLRELSRTTAWKTMK
jgi:hypothetical protein